MFTLIICILLISYICYRIAFFADRKKQKDGEPCLPDGEAYAPYRDRIAGWVADMREMPHEDMYVTSFDGLRLHAAYYEHEKGAPIEIMFHGYRSTAQRDMCGGIKRAFATGHNALLIDQRTSGESEGCVISFGINESRDCLKWIDAVTERFGSDVRIILTGISMGAATVMITAGYDLPENVVGVLADCGYTSAKDIIKKCIGDMHLPPALAYPFVRLGALIFGRFDPEKTSPAEALKKAKVPVIFFHGEADSFVPCCMSEQNFNACASRKRLVTVKDAEHGIAYLADPDRYLKEATDFFSKTEVTSRG